VRFVPEEIDSQRKTQQIAQLVATAKRLRKTRAACRKFLALWALQQGRPTYPDQASKEKQLSDPMNHDWSLLYLGSILDD
jgi:hypothetical protein